MRNSTFSNSAKRAARMNAYVNEGEIISTRMYNLIMGLVVLYGLVINFILCITVGPDIFYSINPILFIILYFVLALSGSFIATKSNSAVVSFLGYNMVVLPLGILVSFIVDVYGGVDSSVVAGAFYYTMLITAIMVLAAILFPQFFSGLGRVLLVALSALLIVGLFMSIFGFYSNVYSYIAAAIFSLYIGFDVWRSQQYPKTADNAVDCALDIYMDIINLFLRLVEILGRKSD